MRLQAPWINNLAEGLKISDLEITHSVEPDRPLLPRRLSSTRIPGRIGWPLRADQLRQVGRLPRVLPHLRLDLLLPPTLAALFALLRSLVRRALQLLR